MCRIVTCSLRIAWSFHERNVSLGIAAQIFVQVGTILLYITNLVFVQRIVRAQHPNWGWHKSFMIAFKLCILWTVTSLIMIIVVSILSFFTLNSNIHRIARIIQLYGSTVFALIAFLPIPVLFVGIVLPKRIRVEKFGIGRFRNKIMILASASLLLTLGAGWRCGTLWLRPQPKSADPWYFCRGFFYAFNFGVEVLVVWLYAIVRVDRRFHVPNGAKGPGDYRKKDTREAAGHTLLPAHPGDYEKNSYRGYDGGYDDFHFDTPYASTLRIYSEEELFDDCSTLAETLKYNSTSLELDNASGRWMLKRQSQASLYSESFRDDVSSRDNQKTADSNIYSTLDAPLASGKAITKFNTDDVKWETISMAHTANSHPPSYTDGDASSYTSLLGANEKAHHYSRDVGLEKPPRAAGDTWASAASEKSQLHHSYHSLTSNATTTAPRTPRSEKRPATEKSGPATSISNYAYDSPETGDLSEKRHHKRESLEVPPQTPRRHTRKSSWRKSVESEMRLSIDEDQEAQDAQDAQDAYEKLTSEKRPKS